ncbi:hypothetical protein ACHAWF_008408, partial [Thalassiosira exigua]
SFIDHPSRSRCGRRPKHPERQRSRSLGELLASGTALFSSCQLAAFVCTNRCKFSQPREPRPVVLLPTRSLATMESFHLREVSSSYPIVDGGANCSGGHAAASRFDLSLHDKLASPGARQENSVKRSFDDVTFDTVRNLFRTAALALESELESKCATRHGDDDDILAHCHWIPGRIEVMGKHTDYAGGNSLVCATAGRGMSMVSSFIADSGESDDGGGLKVTIVSVLPCGMEHHAKKTAAPYRIAGRPVVHHTIRIREGNSRAAESQNESSADCLGEESVDWTIYPTAVIHRLHQNFGLLHHIINENHVASQTNASSRHLLIAISSNLPPASGLSTSSAFVTGLFLALDSHLFLTESTAYRRAIGEPDEESTVHNLSTYLGNVENGRDYIRSDFILEGTVQGGVGTFGGSEDHAAILMGRSDELRVLSFCPTRPCFFTDDKEKSALRKHAKSVVRLSPDLIFVVAYSGAKAEKAGGTEGVTDASIGYNSASDLARKAFEAYFAGGDNKGVESTQTLADAIKWERQQLDIAGASPQDECIEARMIRRIKVGVHAMEEQPRDYSTALVRRFEHFYDESEHLVLAAARALSEEALDALGPIVDASHRGAVNMLKNQIEETAWLPLWARGIDDQLQTNPLHVSDCNSQRSKLPPPERSNKSQRIKAIAASAFGAGFGGSCWALVRRHQAEEFARQWLRAYDERFPPKDNGTCVLREFFLVEPGPGAFRV